MGDCSAWRKAVDAYKEAYFGMYNHPPKEKCIESFCKINKIPWPLPKTEEAEDDIYFVPPHVDMLFGGESEGQE